MVEFLQVFLDPLHLLVRVGDLLLEKLIEEVLDTMVGRASRRPRVVIVPVAATPPPSRTWLILLLRSIVTSFSGPRRLTLMRIQL